MLDPGSACIVDELLKPGSDLLESICRVFHLGSAQYVGISDFGRATKVALDALERFAALIESFEPGQGRHERSWLVQDYFPEDCPLEEETPDPEWATPWRDIGGSG
jgi:hypothetical protein